ncbi:MAG TPA: lipid-A-disaccharide synthase [Candidatus Binataceae bacterium]|jgi:lipid-A-disaccharide synthase|nr:lipid-A-disaccharide synthase [Candidatus Binataceae bacterium]
MRERNGKPLTICLVAGDVSGDQNGGRLARALLDLEPGMRLVGTGGAGMRRGGVEVAVDSTGVSTIGPPDSLQAVRSILRVWNGTRSLVRTTRPDLAVLIDAEGFNVMLARWLRARGVPVVFFFPPQVWLWGRWRLSRIVPLAARVLSAFREEAELYRKGGANSVWVGHPLSDVVRVSEDPAAAMRRIGLASDRPLVVLMPGSRRQEIRDLCGPIMGAAKLLQQRDPMLQFAIPLATEDLRAELEAWVRRSELRSTVIYSPESYAVLSRAKVVLQCSGTATLEAGLLGIPSVIAYRCRPLYYSVGRRLMRVKFIGMVNILLGEAVQPEFFQKDVDAVHLAGEVWSLLTNETRRRHIQSRLAHLPEVLGPTGVMDRAARAVMELLGRAGEESPAQPRSASSGSR